MVNKTTVWAEQEPDEEDDVLQPLQNEFPQPQNQQGQWDLEDQYEQGENQYYAEDGDQEEFKICLQQIDCMNPPIKINLENLPIAANEEQVIQFCMQKCQDKSAVQECVLYKDRGRSTGYGHIKLKTRQAAKNVLWQWGEQLLKKNVQMYLDEEYDESIASEDLDQVQQTSSVPQQQQKINQQTQEQAKKQLPEQQSTSNKSFQQQQELPHQQNQVKKQESSIAVQQIKNEQSAWKTETQEWGSSQQDSWGSSQQDSWGQNHAQIGSSWGNQTENDQGGWQTNPQSS